MMLPVKISKYHFKYIKLAMICRWRSNESTSAWFCSTTINLYAGNVYGSEDKSNAQHCTVVKIDLQIKRISQKKSSFWWNTAQFFTHSYTARDVAEAREKSRSAPLPQMSERPRLVSHHAIRKQHAWHDWKMSNVWDQNKWAVGQYGAAVGK